MNKIGSLNLAVKDLDAEMAFYADLFGFKELTTHRSEHFRVLDANGVLFGFNDAVSAAPYGGLATGGMILSFDVAAPADVERISDQAVARGATLKQAAQETNFGAIGALLIDPEGHAFRILAWLRSPL
jgi:uncharacterized glyoxalase superfamily protein PhnB